METDIYLDFTLEFGDPLYSERTMREWQAVWTTLCEMAYNPKYQSHHLLHAIPYYPDPEEDLNIYRINKDRIANHDLLCFENVWKKYKNRTPVPNTVLKVLYIPKLLIESSDGLEFLRDIFPNCSFIFWEE